MSLRYFCSGCNSRVSPYDTREELTEAPEPGRSGDPVLLRSLNADRRARGLPALAWCWVCDGWIEAYGLSGLELDYRYYERRGVVFRFSGRTRKAFAEELESRRGNRGLGGIITLPQRRRISS